VDLSRPRETLPAISPQYRRYNDAAGFFQYQYVVVPNKLRVLAGSKFEGNPFTGLEFQPQLRAVWTINTRNLLWGSVSRAVRDPSHAEVNLDTIPASIPSPAGPIILHAFGNSDLQSEHLKAYELGYRVQPSRTISLDVATYYNGYDNLIVFAPPAVQPPLQIVTVATNESAANDGTAQTHGAELSAEWQPLRRWMISPTITEIRGSENAMLAVPKHLFGVQSRFDVMRHLDLDAGLYHDNALAATSGEILGEPPTPAVPSFSRVDVVLSWHPVPQWTFGVCGRNLQSQKHIEFVNDFFGGAAGEITRSVSFKAMWRSNSESK
jgi:iron complex outermembrane receptor protein